MKAYLAVRWGELSTVLSVSGAAGVIAAYLLGQMTAKQAGIGLVTALMGYLLPEAKPAAKS
jgi:hypothetical protein